MHYLISPQFLLRNMFNIVITCYMMVITCSILRLDGVKEYLRLSENATKTQLTRIKTLFEKRNQKSAQTIAQLQAKIDSYARRIQELETIAMETQKDAQQKKTVGQGLK